MVHFSMNPANVKAIYAYNLVCPANVFINHPKYALTFCLRDIILWGIVFMQDKIVDYVKY